MTLPLSPLRTANSNAAGFTCSGAPGRPIVPHLLSRASLAFLTVLSPVLFNSGKDSQSSTTGPNISFNSHDNRSPNVRVSKRMTFPFGMSRKSTPLSSIPPSASTCSPLAPSVLGSTMSSGICGFGGGVDVASSPTEPPVASLVMRSESAAGVLTRFRRGTLVAFDPLASP